MLITKQHYGKEFFHLMSAIKKALDKGHEVLFFKKQGNHTTILRLLLDEGFITSFQDHAGFVVVRLKVTSLSSMNSKSFVTLESAHRIGRKNFTISLKELLSLQRREGGTAYYILNTDKGLLTSFAAIENSIGGKLLLKIT